MVRIKRILTNPLFVLVAQYEAFLLHSSCNEMKEAALALSDL